jgi:DNA-binding response OmpR family regulator
MKKQWKTLLLEDNALFAETLKDFLEENGFDVDIVNDGEEAVQKSYYTNYDIYLLDINVPCVNGVDFLKMIRRSGDERPTIFITSHQDIQTLKKGYESGCDDYMKKPIDLEELLYRMDVLLKKRRDIKTTVFLTKNCCYDFKNRVVLRENKPVKLPLKTIKLLELFIENEGQIVTKEQIINRLWSTSSQYSEGAIRVYIAKLKKLIEKDMIENIKGIGYKLTIQS